ncbi:MAG: MBL fold metallo-hydrolase [Caldilineae bacterium]|nr:MAG: MBL fold metallo-hydrolase [Caldilineae bacterium]
MSARTIAPDIYQITLPTPFPVGDVHAYLLRGDPLTLVDTGVYNEASIAALDAALAELGLQASDIEQIILSHGHLDHVGQARRISEAGGARVLAHARACAKVSDQAGYGREAAAWMKTLLPATGLPNELKSMVFAYYAILPRLAQDVQVEACLEEGDEILAGGRMWQVMFCPGHSGDLICLHDADARLLIGSDHLLAHISSNALLEPPRGNSPARRLPLIEYWRSLERIEALDIDLLLPGHGELIDDHRSLLAERREQRDRRLDRIEALTRAAPLTVWQIAELLFPRLKQTDILLAISEVVGHLDWLLMEGRVEQVLGEVPHRYRAVRA